MSPRLIKFRYPGSRQATYALEITPSDVGRRFKQKQRIVVGKANWISLVIKELLLQFKDLEYTETKTQQDRALKTQLEQQLRSDFPDKEFCMEREFPHALEFTTHPSKWFIRIQQANNEPSYGIRIDRGLDKEIVSKILSILEGQHSNVSTLPTATKE